MRTLLIVLVLFFNKLNAQTTESKFVKETKIGFKVGTTVNFFNKQLHQDLNENHSEELYKPISSTYYVNPYCSVGLERHILKHFGLHFNVGFYQTLQNYNYTYNASSSQQAYDNFPATQQTKAQYLNNNVYLELLPVYIYNHLRVFGGLNISRYSPTIMAKLTRTDKITGEKITVRYKDRPEESYHAYSIIGIQQGIPVKNKEIILSASYFGLLKKYDSGVTFAFGILF